jgi:hypothetical protein
MARSGRRLTARLVESEQPGAEINYFQKQHCIRKQHFLDKKLNVLKGFSINCSDCNLSSEYGIMLDRNCSHIERKSNYET